MEIHDSFRRGSTGASPPVVQSVSTGSWAKLPSGHVLQKIPDAVFVAFGQQVIRDSSTAGSRGSTHPLRRTLPVSDMFQQLVRQHGVAAFQGLERAGYQLFSLGNESHELGSDVLEFSR